MANVTRAFIGSASEIEDFGPLLRFLLLNVLIALGLFVLWYFGLLQLVLATDHTRVSILIFAIFCLTGLHCLYQTVVISRELVSARKVRDIVVAESGSGLRIDGDRVMTGNRTVLEPGIMTNHIINIIRKRRLQSERHVDQTLLLRSLADKLRGREKLGLFVSEGLLRLALLGTAIGFILMLIPIAGLSSFDAETLRGALAGMTGGMAIALNVTVSGIATALILKFEYFQLDHAIAELFDIIAEVSEIHVVPAIEKAQHGRA